MHDTELDEARRTLLAIYQAALVGVDGRARVRDYLRGWGRYEAFALVAVGKAAQAMAQGAVEACGARISDGLVISKHGHLDRRILGRLGFKGLEAGHPIPDQCSLDAGQALVDFIRQQPSGRPLLFLISGGASSLVELLAPGLSLDDLRRANQWLLGSGLGIDDVNRVRKALSLIKGGGLLRYLDGCAFEGLLISDVPGDDPMVIASGMLVADPSVAAGVERLSLPAWLQDMLPLHVPTVPGAPSNGAVSIVASLDLALDAATVAAKARGLEVIRHRSLLLGEAEAEGRRVARVLFQSSPVLHLWGGETRVRLPAQAGQGGRNQHLALAAALEMTGQHGICLLAAGTDGTDGVSEDAGALVDGGTLQRAAIEGWNAGDCLRRADSGPFLASSGDLFQTGPTGTNVMDIVLGLRFAA